MNTLKVLVINDEAANMAVEKDILIKASSYRDKLNIKISYLSPNDKVGIEQALPEVDGVISVCTEFNKNTISTMKKCKIIATQSIGVDLIDLSAATNSGIYVTNVPDYCVEEVAIHTVALVFACLRKLKIYDKFARNKIWNIADIHNLGTIHRLRGQTYGMLAFGKIPKKIAPIIKSMGMKVIAYDPYVAVDIFEQHGVEKIETLDELFTKSNIISLHAPLTAETKEMVTLSLLKKLPQNAILVNTARGKIIKEDDLCEALKKNYLLAAGTDVIFDEVNYQSALYQLENIIITPHVAYYSEESVLECRIKAAEQIKEVLINQKIPSYLVNKDIISLTN